MIHYVYLGHFAREGNFIKLERVPETQPSWYRPVVVSRFDPKLIAKLLSEQGVSESSLPGDWGISLEKEGFVAFDRHTRNIAARKFVKKLAQQTRCDIVDYSSLSLLSTKDLWQGGHPENHEKEKLKEDIQAVAAMPAKEAGRTL